MEQTHGGPFDPAYLVRENIRAYRSCLISVQRCKPAIVNRCLSALWAFWRWTVATGDISADPTGDIPPDRQAPAPFRAPDTPYLRQLIWKAQRRRNLLHAGPSRCSWPTRACGSTNFTTCDWKMCRSRSGKGRCSCEAGKGRSTGRCR
jgi:hypothetical protein